MSNKTVRYAALLAVLILAAAASGCTSRPLSTETPLTVLGTLAAAGITEPTEARIVVSRNKHVMEETVPVINTEFSATLRVPVGEWAVSVLLVDAQGIVLYQSKSQTVKITLHQEQVLELVLRPADSEVHVSIDLADYVFRHVAMRARIHFNDEVYEAIREDSQSPLEKTIVLSPGSYEFKIELYTESFRIGDRISPGVWQVIHISENEEMHINWSPVSERLYVTGRVETLLPSPANFKLEPSAEGVLLTWDPVVHREVTGYFLFVQGSPLERYELLTSLPLSETSFLHALDQDQAAEVYYAVAAVSTSGLVGYYSTQQYSRP